LAERFVPKTRTAILQGAGDRLRLSPIRLENPPIPAFPRRDPPVFAVSPTLYRQPAAL